MAVDVEQVRRACDDLVAASPDPAAAMATLVELWLLGGLAGDDLLDDLEHIAVTAAITRGVELTVPELLDAFGQQERAQRIRTAVEAGRRRHHEAAQRAGRLLDVRLARGVAA